jgi:hypothetical protein
VSAVYRYFVVYKAGCECNGRAELRRSAPIRSIDDIASIEAELKEQTEGISKDTSIIITNWRRFEEEESR